MPLDSVVAAKMAYISDYGSLTDISLRDTIGTTCCSSELGFAAANRVGDCTESVLSVRRCVGRRPAVHLGLVRP